MYYPFTLTMYVRAEVPLCSASLPTYARSCVRPIAGYPHGGPEARSRFPYTARFLLIRTLRTKVDIAKIQD